GGNVVLANEPTQDDFVKVFPNPSDDRIKVEFLENVGEFRISLINFIGQSIVQSQTNEIDVSKVASGTYFLKIETDKKRALRKVVINH
ncbi:MAG: T9SS type A sorting domain-containing protein, partial [Emticicia sp.]|uniref:T9SS type A sorting domain-containing protein n=1 Tax=Emticicia sp. TaxID=1930953 RepID=UPI003BA58355